MGSWLNFGIPKMSSRDYTVIFCELKNKKRTNKKTTRKNDKIITWKEAINESRPPLRIDMSGPTPMEYNVSSNNYKIHKSSPAYSFGRKCINIATSADGKSVNPFLLNTESGSVMKPSPAAYNPSQAIGHGQSSFPSAPAFSIGPARELKLGPGSDPSSQRC